MAAVPRNPSTAHVGVFDYTQRTHMSLYKDNIEGLYEDEKEGKFGLEPEKLQGFMAYLHVRVTRCNWNAMLTYQVPNPSAGGALEPIYLVNHYGEIPSLIVRAAAIVYLTAGQRTSQDSEQLYRCLLSSITKDAFNRVMNESNFFHVVINGEELADGPLLLHKIVSLAYTNSRSMSSVYRNRLSMLTQKMNNTPGSNIEVFNTHVRTLVNLLAAGGERCEDLAWNLLRAYKATGDQAFTAYITTKEDLWKEGNINWGANGNDLMNMAENYYQDALANEKWLRASEEQERIIALEAHIKTLTPFTHNRDNDRRCTKSDGKQDKKGRKWPKWKEEPPKGSEAKVKTKDGTKYHWCQHHARWTVHSPDECNLASTPQVVAEAVNTQTPATRRGRYATAMTTIHADSDDDSKSDYDTGNESDSGSNN
mmetsp:Transcript_1833/g.2805  ORF Transcript_1833/g.2805 Transcript_1833/m.2805 type:complete len:423 (+) Transcript_1833:8407-9675(+)